MFLHSVNHGFTVKLTIPYFKFLVVRQDRTWNDIPNTLPPRGGGIGALISTKYGYSSQHLQHYNRNTNYLECLWLEIIFEHCKNITLGIVYRPPAGNVNMFCEELTDIVQDITNMMGNDVIILGDFNVQYNDKSCNNYKDLLQFEQLTNLTQLINVLTRQTNIIDLIYTNSNNIHMSGVLDILISDHELIYCTRKKKKSKVFKTEFTGRSYRNYDIDSLQNQLITHDWTNYMSIDNVNQCWDYITYDL